ncbi:BREX-1 system adenine-specific DNA-methyltransferase PglX, partial [Leptospira ognonensis]
MDTSKLKNFAQLARRSLMDQVKTKLKLVLSKDSLARRENPEAVKTLEEKIALSNEASLIEAVAYTWFNRFCALRFMDVNGYNRIRIISPADEGQFQPEILAEAKAGHIDAEMVAEPIRKNILSLLAGTTTSRDPQQEAYRLLIVAACNDFHRAMPFLFERIADYTELLMPEDLLSGNSILAYTREAMTPEACQDVEVIGWLYQFYISEKKDAVMARKSAVPTEDIPAVTQLFTPHWIVRYLVENSLGRLWLLNHPSSKLREHMPYYIEGDSETDFLKVSKPEEIRLLDPAVGSGHMLTYAFDLLYLIYEETGAEPSEIPEKILTYNLYGVEIDQRAGELAAFALTMKARAKQRRFFTKAIKPNICVLENVKFAEKELREYIKALNLDDLFNQPVIQLLHQFEEAKNFGSLIQPCLDKQAITDARHAIEAKDLSGQLFLRETHLKVLRVLEQAEILTQRYHVVVANPPYMGSGFFITIVKEFIAKNYSPGRYDLYAAFIQRNILLVLKRGFVAMITMPNWIFLGSDSFVRLRKTLLFETHISSLVHAGRGVWGADFGSVSFVLHSVADSKTHGTFKRLFTNTSEVTSNEVLSRRFFDRETYPSYSCVSEDFLHIPDYIIAYWLSDKCRKHFNLLPPLGSEITSREGMATGNNSLFLRKWNEVSLSRICFTQTGSPEEMQSLGRWFPYNKGGDYRKWYGNNELVVDWENNGVRVRTYQDEETGRIRSHNYNGDYAFRAGITWSALSISRISVRHSDEGFLFDSKGAKAFASKNTDYYMALINSAIGEEFLKALSPGVDFKVGDIIKIPLIEELELSSKVSERTFQAVSLARTDWDNFETSWDFRDLPLLRPGLKGGTLSASWQNWERHCTSAIRMMQELETENNRLFIAAYELEGELQPEVPEEQITLARAELAKDMRDFISYSVGCMFGRYSLDEPGLILANAGDTIEDYLKRVPKTSFHADDDNVIPVLDGDWFSDDIAGRFREFLKVTFGQELLEENLRFIET